MDFSKYIRGHRGRRLRGDRDGPAERQDENRLLDVDKREYEQLAEPYQVKLVWC